MDIFELPLYIINLKKDIDRKIQATNVIKSLGFKNVHIVVPVDPDYAITHPLVKNSHNKYKASHALTMFNIIKNEKSKYFIIIEDDICLKYGDINYNKNLIKEIWDSAQKYNFDMLYFEYCNNLCSMSNKIDKHLYKLYNPLCAAFIVYTQKFKNEILKDLNNFKKSDAYDIYLQNTISNGSILALGYPVFKQDPKFESNLPILWVIYS